MIFICVLIFFIYKNFENKHIEIEQHINLRSELNKIGVIKVAESTRKYKRVFKSNNFLPEKYTLIHYYTAYIEYDLNDIVINENINDKEVKIIIFKNKIIVSKPVLIKDNSFTEKKIISRSFKIDDIIKIQEETRKEVKKSFNCDSEFINKGIQSLKEKLVELLTSLGFEKIDIIINNEV